MIFTCLFNFRLMKTSFPNQITIVNEVISYFVAILKDYHAYLLRVCHRRSHVLERIWRIHPNNYPTTKKPH